MMYALNNVQLIHMLYWYTQPHWQVVDWLSMVLRLRQHNIGYTADGFYPRDAMLARVIAITACLSVCPSVRHAPVLCQNEES